MAFGEEAIATVQWSSLPVLSRTGEELATALLALIASREHAEAQQAWWSIENVVFAQDTIYGAAEATVDVMLASLVDDRPQLARSWIVELLFFLLKGGSREDPTLPDRCRDRARYGVWLLAREAQMTSGPERQLVLTVVELIDAEVARAIGTWLAGEEGSGE